MPKLKCKCDRSINLSPIPNPQGFKLVWEIVLETLIDELVIAYKEAARGA